MKALILIFVIALTACASNRTEVTLQRGSTSELITYARSLLGTPYRYGGRSPSTGFDCSGFTDHVFLQTQGIKLPRRTRDISRKGIPVKRNFLSEGDLVFFNTQRSDFSHVGIYLGNNRFIHAPSSGGQVRIEDIEDNYWRRRYNGARRIISPR